MPGCDLRGRGGAHKTPGPGGQRPFRHRGSPAGAANNAKDGNQVPPRGPAATHNTIVAAPEEVRDQVRNLTRMQRLRTCAAWRPDTIGYRDPVVATKLALKYLARRILDLNDEIAELDRYIVPWSRSSPPVCLSSKAWAPKTQAQ